MNDEAAFMADSGAGFVEFLELAGYYHDGALTLLARAERLLLETNAPGRLLAIHAIELYLSAFLAHGGTTETSIRAMGHDLASRVEAAAGGGLVLRRGTVEHLAAMSREREYVALRYGLTAVRACAPESRLLASLIEVSRKVCKAVSAPV